MNIIKNNTLKNNFINDISIIRKKVLNNININNQLNVCSVYLFIKNKLNFVIDNDLPDNSIILKNDIIIFNQHLTTLLNFDLLILYIICKTLYRNHYPELARHNKIKTFIQSYLLNDLDSCINIISTLDIQHHYFQYKIDEFGEYLTFTNISEPIVLYIKSNEDLQIISNVDLNPYIDRKMHINDNITLCDSINFNNIYFKSFLKNIYMFEWILYNTNITNDKILSYIEYMIIAINNSNYNQSKYILKLFNIIKKHDINNLKDFLYLLDQFQIDNLFGQISKNDLYVFFHYLCNTHVYYLFNNMDFKDKLQYSKYINTKG